MCGIAGIIGKEAGLVNPDHLVRMRDKLESRGPDDFGQWCNASQTVGLAHRRLSVLDLSPAGHQPMISKSGRYVIVFNGEIFNHELLRVELGLGRDSFSGGSDTETILCAIERWGVSGAVSKFIGMFAFGLYDAHDESVYLCRDRLGVKPLYYFENEKYLLFSSQVNSLLEHPSCVFDIDHVSLSDYFRHGYIAGSSRIISGVVKVDPGCIVKINRNNEKEVIVYWSLSNVVSHGVENLFSGSYLDAVNRLDELLTDSVNLRMLSDVPLGAFLSGGIDSSLIVSLMQKVSSRPIKTFSIGFSEEGYNEAVFAREVAAHLGTDHTELYLTESDAMSVIPELADIYDEPFADVSQIPTILVSRLARQDVTVTLSGDGGDELFGGYNRYIFAEKFWGRIRLFPCAFRKLISKALYGVTPSSWDFIFNKMDYYLPFYSSPSLPGMKMHKLAKVINSRNVPDLHESLSSIWSNSNFLISEDISRNAGDFDNVKGVEALGSPVSMQMFIDTMTYLPEDILTKVDRASMSVGLEARTPFLDHRIVEFAWSLPENFKISDGVGKKILRDLLERYVPYQLYDRPKMGFGVPIGSWLRGPLRDWAESYLSEDSLNRIGILHVGNIRSLWIEHLSMKKDWSSIIWAVLMFVLWVERYKK